MSNNIYQPGMIISINFESKNANKDFEILNRFQDWISNQVDTVCFLSVTTTEEYMLARLFWYELIESQQIPYNNEGLGRLIVQSGVEPYEILYEQHVGNTQIFGSEPPLYWDSAMDAILESSSEKHNYETVGNLKLTYDREQGTPYTDSMVEPQVQSWIKSVTGPTILDIRVSTINIINEVRKQVAKGQINPLNVDMGYVTQDSNEVRVAIDRNGRFYNFPECFDIVGPVSERCYEISKSW